jgi:hypothetical protein
MVLSRVLFFSLERRTAASAARSSGTAGRPAGRRAALAFLRNRRDELLQIGRAARRTRDLGERTHHELLEEPPAFLALILEDGHRVYLFADRSSLAPSAAPLSTVPSCVFPDRSPISQVWDIQVGTPRRGSTNFMRTIQTARMMRTLIMAFNRPFEPVFVPRTSAATGFRRLSVPASTCRESCIFHRQARSIVDSIYFDDFSAKARSLPPSVSASASIRSLVQGLSR